MIINISERGAIPEAELFVEHIAKKGSESDLAQTIILAPGGPGSDHSIYKEQIDQLTNFVNVIIFDPRGCGESSIASKEEYDMNVYIDDIETIRGFFNLNRFILLGTSYGSMVAQGYAIKYGHRLTGLILVAGAPSFEFIDMARSTIEACGGGSAQKEMFARLLDGRLSSDDDLREYFKVMASLYTIKPKQAETKDIVEFEEFHSANKTVRYNYEAALAGFGPGGFLHTFDWRPRLGEIGCPVRVIVGEHDWINNQKQAFEIQKFVKDCKVEVISSGSHFVWIDQKDQYFSVLSVFLMELTALGLSKKSDESVGCSS